METSNSDDNHFVFHAQNDRWGLGPMETSYSGDNHAVLQAQNDMWGLGLLILGIMWTLGTHKTTDEGWDP